jgi:cystathionine gamma-synthase
VLAKLEGGVEAASFSSGNAAGMSVFQSLGAGYTYYRTQMICITVCVTSLKMLFAGILEFDFIDVNDSEVLKATY